MAAGGLDKHRLEMIELARQVNERAGLADDPAATAEKAQEMMRSLGIRPEDNLFSRDIIRNRYEVDLPASLDTV